MDLVVGAASPQLDPPTHGMERRRLEVGLLNSQSLWARSAVLK
jgi:hypothetical protein